jgi:hypothetical protein
MTNTEKAGGTRYSAGKPGMFWAIPLYGLRLIARVTEAGARKYAPRDWFEGQSFSTLIDCTSRHWLEVCTRGPWAKDEDTGCYHLAAVGWNVLCLLTFMELERYDLDDVTPWFGVKAGDKVDITEQALASYARSMLEDEEQRAPSNYPGKWHDLESQA